MKVTFLLMLFASITTLSQDIPKFELTKEGIKPIVVNIDSFTTSALYDKSLKWIQETYKNPELVLKTKIENEKIRIDGYKQEACYFKSLGIKTSFDVKYYFEVEFKDNKIRLTYLPYEFWSSGRKMSYTYEVFFNNSGEVRAMYKEAKSTLETSMNELVTSLYTYIKGSNKKDDW